MTDVPSKSAEKRAQQVFKSLTERLVELTVEQLDQLPVDQDVRDALHQYRQMTAHGARRRQRQLITKLLRRSDPEPINARLQRLVQAEKQDKALFRMAEHWRELIYTGGRRALREFSDEFALTNSSSIRS